MARRALAISALGALAGLFFACLPELSAIKGPLGTDAGEESGTTTNACGDGFIDDDAGEACDPGEAVATSTTCINCAIQCTGGRIDPQSGHCYFLANTSATYEQATEACKGGHIVTIDSDRESAFVGEITSLPYWLGYKGETELTPQVATEPGFPIDGGCPGCYVRKLGVAEDAGGGCVVASDGGWEISSCTDAGAATICEREPLGQRSFYCQGPYCATVTFTVGTKRYLLYLDNAARNASAAAAECAALQGQLVVFETREERAQVVQELLRLGVETPLTAWIGATNDGGTWTWDDGRLVDDGGLPSPWGVGQPNAATGRAFIRIGSFLDSQLAQANADDTALRPFICQRAP